ncbi:MAG: HAMP domain-containing histidine kinase, partial [Verrucomicrobiaceae bacterium]
MGWNLANCIANLRTSIADRPLEVALFSSPLRSKAMGALLFVGHPLFGVLESTVIAQPYENLWVRALMGLSGLVLVFGPVPDDPRSRFGAWICSVLWWVHCVVFMAWMYFNNDGSPLWLATFSIMTLIYFTLTDWRLAVLGSLAGVPIGYLLHATVTNVDSFNPSAPGEQIAVVGFTYAIAVWLSYTSGSLRAERLKVVGQLMGILAHELRTPIATIAMTTDVLDGRDESPDDKRLAAIVRESVVTMNGVIDLQIANSRTFSLRSAKSPTIASDLCKTLRDTYPFRNRSERSHIKLSVASNYQIDVSPKLVHPALSNVLKNAIEAVAAARGKIGEGDITITFFREGERGCVMIRDRGIGMNATTKSKMFDPFFSTAPRPGHGLGLAFV